MKKIRGLFLSGLILFLLSGCSWKGDVALEAEAGAKQLKIGCVEYETYNYVNEGGEWIGIDADLAKEACNRLGYEPVFVPVKWNEKDSFLENGSVDCIWNCFSMNGREEKYLWAGPYMTSREVVMVKESSEIRSIADLKGKVLAVQTGTKPEEMFLEENDLPATGYVYCFRELQDGMVAMQQNYVDAVAGHQAFLELYSRNMSGMYRVLDEPLLISQIGVAFAKDGDQQLAEQFNRILHEMNRNGTVGAIMKKYEISPAMAVVTEGDESE